MYRFLLSRQWVILTLLGLVLIPSMIKLGFWQLHRHESRVAHNELIASSLSARPVPFERLSGTGGHRPAEDDQFRTAKATGRYDTRHEVVVRQRTGADEHSIGYFVLTPLIRDDGRAVLVNRGWIAADGDLTRFPEVPAPPRGQVTVTGRFMLDETSAASGIKDKAGLPPRQVMLIDSRQQAKALNRPVLSGHLQLTATSPKPPPGQPEQIPEPDHSGIGAHMAYAVQWWLFASAVPAGWVVLVRRERRDRLAAAAAPEQTDRPHAPSGPDRPESTDGQDRRPGARDEPDASDGPARADETADQIPARSAPSTTPAGVPPASI